MGKMINLISMIVLVDILFITFWGGSTSLESIIVNWIISPANFEGNFVTILIENLFSTIAVGAIAAVVVNAFGAKTDTVLFATFASGTIYNLGKDYLFMYQQVALVNELIATVAIVPFIILFAFITIEWLKGRD